MLERPSVRVRAPQACPAMTWAPVPTSPFSVRADLVQWQLGVVGIGPGLLALGGMISRVKCFQLDHTSTTTQ